jgi:FGGY family of carbohydrate kinases, C-terminal domain
MLGTDLVGLGRLAMSAEPGAGGLVLLPYLDGERTPDLPDAIWTLGGLTRTNATPEDLARAAVEGMLCGLADGMDVLQAQGLQYRRSSNKWRSAPPAKLPGRCAHAMGGQIYRTGPVIPRWFVRWRFGRG